MPRIPSQKYKVLFLYSSINNKFLKHKPVRCFPPNNVESDKNTFIFINYEPLRWASKIKLFKEIQENDLLSSEEHVAIIITSDAYRRCFCERAFL